MFGNKKYTVVALAALGASGQEVRALSHQAGNQWHLAMVPDSYPENSFISQPGRDMGFGVGGPLGFNLGGDFGFGSGFSDFPRPHLDTFSDEMRSMMQHDGEGATPGKGQSFSSSSSSSYSSATGADGKRHEKSSKSGQQEVCKDGQCKIVQCENGKCKEMVASASVDSRAAVDQEVASARPALSAVEQSLKRNFERIEKSMGQHTRQMQEGSDTRAHHHRGSHPEGGAEPKEGQVITKEQFKEILKKLKERHALEHPGEKPEEIEVRIAPAGGEKGAGQHRPSQQANVPVPPPAFAPKDK